MGNLYLGPIWWTSIWSWLYYIKFYVVQLHLLVFWVFFPPLLLFSSIMVLHKAVHRFFLMVSWLFFPEFNIIFLFLAPVANWVHKKGLNTCWAVYLEYLVQCFIFVHSRLFFRFHACLWGFEGSECPTRQIVEIIITTFC